MNLRKRISMVSLLGAFSLNIAVATATVIEQCPKDPDKIKSMIKELKQTFECSGVSVETCGHLRSGDIGTGQAAAVAAGVALMKRSGISCPMGGAVSMIDSRPRGTSIVDMVVFNVEVATAKGATCTIGKPDLSKELKVLQQQFRNEAEKAAVELKGRLLAERLPAIDAAKVEVTREELRRRFVSSMDTLEKELRAGTSTPQKAWVLENIEFRRSLLKSAPLDTVMTEIGSAYDAIDGRLTEETRTKISDATKESIKYWKYIETVRAEKVAKLAKDSVTAAAAAVDLDLEKLIDTTSSETRRQYLAGRGYKTAAVDALIEIDNARRGLVLNASSMQRAVYELEGGTFAKAASLGLDQVKQLVRTAGAQFLDHPLFHFRVMPGLNSSLTSVIKRAGEAAIAKVAVIGESRLGLAAKIALPVLGTVGKAIAGPVTGLYEGLSFNDGRNTCGADLASQFAPLEMVEGKSGAGHCVSVATRTPATDQFLFNLSSDEQLREVRNNNQTCNLLLGMHRQYAPSRNWSLQCDGARVHLSGKNADGDGQAVRFEVGSGGLPKNIEWYSKSFERCAKVSVVDNSFGSAQVYETKSGMSSCGSAGPAVRIGRQELFDRRVVGDSKKMVKEFSEWQAYNSMVFSTAAECCHDPNASNDMCPKSGPGRSRDTIQSPTDL